ncbi:hypothetical protein KAR91_08445 [Candidatus Pacearchaeota archaeon]|nr:hypothetical protein [Candidatus Pacearchaeota archaeon]
MITSGEIPATKIGSSIRIPGSFIKEKEEDAFSLEVEFDDCLCQ